MFKARSLGNIANGVVSVVPASFAGISLEANSSITVKDGASGLVVGYFLGTTSGGAWSYVTPEWPVYCANGIHVYKAGAPNAIIHYV